MASRSWIATAIVFGFGAAQCLFPYVDPLTGSGSTGADASVDGPKEASTDGGSDVTSDVPAGRYCATLSPTPSFCDDFDDTGLITPKWDGVSTNAGATIARDSADSVSAPSSLLAVSPPGNGTSSAYAYHASVSPKSKVRVAFDIKIDARDTQSGYAEIDYIRFEGAGFQFASYLRVNTPSKYETQLAVEAYLPDGGIPVHDLTVTGGRFDQWTRVAITFDLASNPHLASVSINGVQVASQALEANMYGPGPVTVRPGIGFVGSPAASSWKIRQDNLTIDWE